MTNQKCMVSEVEFNDTRARRQMLVTSSNMGTKGFLKSMKDKGSRATLIKNREGETRSPTKETSSSGEQSLSKVFSNAPQSAYETPKSADTRDSISGNDSLQGINRRDPVTSTPVHSSPKDSTLSSQNDITPKTHEHVAANRTFQHGNFPGNKQAPETQIAQDSENKSAKLNHGKSLQSHATGHHSNWDWGVEYQKLKAKNQELQVTVTNLTDEKQVLSGEKLSLESENHRLYEDLRDAQVTIEERIKECDSLSQRLQESDKNLAETLESKNALAELNHKWSQAFDKYQKQLEDERAKVADLDQKRQRLAGQLATYKAEAGSSADDEFFESQWTNLDKLIVNWSRAYFEGRPWRRETSNENEQLKDMRHFRQIAPDPYEYLENRNRMPYFAQSFVWSVLVDRVFAYPGRDAGRHLSGLFWARRHRDSLDAIAGFLYPVQSRAADGSHDSDSDTRNYMKWRTLTAQLMLKRLNRDPDKAIVIDPALIEGEAEYVLKHLQHWRNAKFEGDCKQKLRAILQAAIELDAKMSRNWALLVACQGWRQAPDGSLHGAPFDHSIMACGEEGRSMDSAKVKLVLTPALVRYGTSEGESYKIPTVIRRAEVLVELDAPGTEDEFEESRSRSTTSAEIARKSKGVMGLFKPR